MRGFSLSTEVAEKLIGGGGGGKFGWVCVRAGSNVHGWQVEEEGATTLSYMTRHLQQLGQPTISF